MKRIRFRKKQSQKKQTLEIYPINEKIRAPEVRVIDEEGQMLGVFPTRQAIDMAKERELDLVAVSPKAQPPVARFLNYGNFKYQQEKAAKKQKSQQRKTEVKDIRLSPRIGKHDLEFRLKQADKFLKRGDKINIEIILKGRERQHPELAKEIIQDFINTINSQITEIEIEQAPKKQGNKIVAIVFPSNKSKETKPETDKETDKIEINKDKPEDQPKLD
ncbi:MAG: translation initiation factor IF-3 [Candidatus Buchananbacteria bacterium]|nr:translation initiation factor IF-3 [Candidatus Buchananbacteria bacterium]